MVVPECDSGSESKCIQLPFAQWIHAMVRTQFFDTQSITDLAHTERVVKLSLELARAEIDHIDRETLELVEIIALLHDIASWTWRTLGAKHPKGIELVRCWFKQIRYPDLLTESVLDALSSTQDGGVVKQVVQDAVLLDALNVCHLEDAVDVHDEVRELTDIWRTSTMRSLSRLDLEGDEELDLLMDSDSDTDVNSDQEVLSETSHDLHL